MTHHNDVPADEYDSYDRALRTRIKDGEKLIPGERVEDDGDYTVIAFASQNIKEQLERTKPDKSE